MELIAFRCRNPALSKQAVKDRLIRFQQQTNHRSQFYRDVFVHHGPCLTTHVGVGDQCRGRLCHRRIDDPVHLSERLVDDGIWLGHGLIDLRQDLDVLSEHRIEREG